MLSSIGRSKAGPTTTNANANTGCWIDRAHDTNTNTNALIDRAPGTHTHTNTNATANAHNRYALVALLVAQLAGDVQSHTTQIKVNVIFLSYVSYKVKRVFVFQMLYILFIWFWPW